MSYDALFEASLTLENEGAFYRAYHEATPRAYDRREVIRCWVRTLALRDVSATASIEQLRRYFDNRYLETLKPLIPTVGEGMWENKRMADPWAPVKPATPTPTPTPAKSGNPTAEKEITMTTTAPIEITTKTLANGVDIASMPDASIYALISAEEARIKELQLIESKPKMLEAEIDKRKAGVAALVAYLDSKFKG